MQTEVTSLITGNGESDEEGEGGKYVWSWRGLIYTCDHKTKDTETNKDEINNWNQTSSAQLYNYLISISINKSIRTLYQKYISFKKTFNANSPKGKTTFIILVSQTVWDTVDGRFFTLLSNYGLYGNSRALDTTGEIETHMGNSLALISNERKLTWIQQSLFRSL